MVIKKCTKCKLEKELALFAKSTRHKNGCSSWCKTCKAIGAVKSAQKKKAHYSTYKSNWLKDNDCPALQRRYKNYHLNRKYGISIDQYEVMIVAQMGKCAICDKLQIEDKIDFAVDHCHKTGQIRGLLCCSCNRGIGFLKDSVRIVNNAAAYLGKYEKKA